MPNPPLRFVDTYTYTPSQKVFRHPYPYPNPQASGDKLLDSEAADGRPPSLFIILNGTGQGKKMQLAAISDRPQAPQEAARQHLRACKKRGWSSSLKRAADTYC